MDDLSQFDMLRALRQQERRIGQTEVKEVPLYQTGLWTPVIQGLTTAGVGTYTTQFGAYVRVGALVVCTCMVIWTAHTGTGQMVIAALPFNSANTTNQRFAVALRTSSVTFAGAAPQALILPNTAYFSLEYPVSNAAANAINIEAAGDIVATFAYFV